MAFDMNDLTPSELFVVERTRAGEAADLTASSGPGGARVVVRAAFLRRLLLQLDPNWGVRTPGVRLRGARIEGPLDLTDCAGAGDGGLPALTLTECEFADPIDISYSRIARFSLAGSRFSRLVADEAQIDGEFNLCNVAPVGAAGQETLVVKARGIRVDGDILARGAKFARGPDLAEDALMLQGAEISGNVLLDHGFDCFGCLWIMNARISGGISMEDATVLNRSDSGEGQAINADGIEVRSVSMRGKFRAEGEARFLSARIAHDVDISGGSFKNDGGIALNFVNADVGGQFWGEGAKILGVLLLQGARIERNLELKGAEIAPRALQRGDTHGRAIDAASLSVAGAALFHGANIKGEILLADARLQGYLAFGGGRFINGGAWAIRAPNARVGGNVTFKIAEQGYAPLGQKTVIEGGVKFDRAQIDGALAWSSLELRGPGPDNTKGGVLSFADARINGPVQATGLNAQEGALIDASGASCAALDDDVKAGWGPEGVRLELQGFDYGRLERGDKWRQRLAWLRRVRRDDQAFSPQPYTHLAQVYARAGQREDARRVMLAQHDLRTLRASSGPLTWALSSAFGLIAGYGLAPIRIVRALVLFLALGVMGVLAMNAQGALVRPDGTACNGAVEPALYTVDVALPIIDLGQEGRCGPGRTARADLPAGVEVQGTEWRLFEGAALWTWAHALYRVLGAVLTALAVLTFSGVMKPKDE